MILFIDVQGKHIKSYDFEGDLLEKLSNGKFEKKTIADILYEFPEQTISKSNAGRTNVRKTTDSCSLKLEKITRN